MRGWMLGLLVSSSSSSSSSFSLLSFVAASDISSVADCDDWGSG